MASVHDLSSRSSYVPITPLPLPGPADKVKLIDAPSVTASGLNPPSKMYSMQSTIWQKASAS